MSRTRCAWDLPDSDDRAISASPQSSATELISVAVSRASTRMTLRGLRRDRHRNAQLRQPLAEKQGAGSAVGDHRACRQCLEEHAPIAFCPQAWVADDDDAEVVEIPNQASHSLFQGEHRLRQLI